MEQSFGSQRGERKNLERVWLPEGSPFQSCQSDKTAADTGIEPSSRPDTYVDFDGPGCQFANPRDLSTALIEDSSPESPADCLLNREKRAYRFHGWCLELLCVVLSIGAVVSIFAVLRTFDGKPLSTWDVRVTVSSYTPINISLNFVVSLLGALAKSTTALVLSAGLSQLKWNWFTTQSRPLRDFELFDSASRGPTGSVQLLWRTRAIRLASLGAFLTILSITFDPFLQLLINYPGVIISLPDSAVTLPLAHRYTGGSEIEQNTAPDSDIIGAVENALWNMNTRFNPDYHCDICYDLSDQLIVTYPTSVSYGDGSDGSASSVSDINMQYSLKSPLNILLVNSASPGDPVGSSNLVSGMATTWPNATLNFQNSQTLLMSLAIIAADHAYAEGSVIWNNTVQLSEHQAALVKLGNFSLPQKSVDSLLQHLSSTFNANLQSTEPNNVTAILYPDDIQYDPSTVQAIWSAPSLETMFHNLANDLSSVIRNDGTKGSNSSAADESAALAPLTGSAQSYVVIIAIRWPFIAGPTVIVVLAAVFLLATIVETRLRRMPIWKEGALASLVWGLDANTREMARKVWAQTDLTRRQMVVVFRGNKLTGELVYS
ncbi:hypothetical protein DV736_g284, partial [Chaetothyriales sp. CBS 134916]